MHSSRLHRSLVRGGCWADGDPGCPTLKSHLCSKTLGFLAPWIKVPSALASFPSSRRPLPPPNWNHQTIPQCSLLICIHRLPAWSRPPALSPGPCSASFCPTVYPPPAARGDLFKMDVTLCHSKPCGGSISFKVKAKCPPRSCTIQPASPPLPTPTLCSCHTGLLTVSQAYQTHSHLRTFALAFSLF